MSKLMSARMNVSLKAVALVAVILLSMGQAHAATQLPFTDLQQGTGANMVQNFTLLALGGTTFVNATNWAVPAAGNTSITITNHSNIFGNVGYALNGGVSGSNFSINGTLDGFNQPAVGGTNITITSQVNAGNLVMNNVVTSAMQAYEAGVSFSTATNALFPTAINAVGAVNSVTINAQVAANNVNVVELANLVLNGGNLTLHGSASDFFVINVNGEFSVTGGGNILLTGGITPYQVLFDVTGCEGTAGQGGTCTHVTGTGLNNTQQVIFGDGITSSAISGTILAPFRDIALSAVVVNGEVISGNQTISISNSSLALTPEPATLMLLGTGLAALAARRRRRK